MKKEAIHSIFENIAPNYDWMNWVISLGLHRLWRRRALTKLNIESGARVLDVCCGTGNWTVKLAREVGPEGEVIGVDFSETMLEIGVEKIEDLDLNQVTLKQGNTLNLKFKAETFDYVTVGFGLRNVTDLQQALAEMKRVAKERGVIASLELSHPVYKGYRELFNIYVFNVVPWLGKLFTNQYEEYAWLPKSLADFPDSKELEEIFSKVGFKQVKAELFAGGAVALHIGKK